MIKLATFQPRIWCSYQQAIPASHMQIILSKTEPPPSFFSTTFRGRFLGWSYIRSSTVIVTVLTLNILQHICIYIYIYIYVCVCFVTVYHTPLVRCDSLVLVQDNVFRVFFSVHTF